MSSGYLTMERKPFALAVRILLFNENGQILLLQRSKRSKTNPGKWELPGGKIDAGESFDTALTREILEETGLTIQIHHAVGTAEQILPNWHVVHLVMMGHIESGNVGISEEHDSFRWTGIGEMKDLQLADWFEEYYDKTLSGLETTVKREP
jgi:8-oxo-dGTP diphosphatase